VRCIPPLGLIVSGTEELTMSLALFIEFVQERAQECIMGLYPKFWIQLRKRSENGRTVK